MAIDWIKVIADDNRLYHEGPWGGLEGLPGWGSGTAYPETTAQPSGWTSYVPWSHLTRDSTGFYAPLSGSDASLPWTDPRVRIGNRAPNTRVHGIHDQMLWLLNDGTWIVGAYQRELGRTIYPYSWAEGTEFQMQAPFIRDETGGGTSLRALGLVNDTKNPSNPNQYANNIWHPFGSRNLVPSNWVGVLSVVFFRLIVDDPSQTDDRALCNILAGRSWDWYIRQDLQGAQPQQGVNVLYGGFSRLKYLTNDWQIFANTNLSESQLRANPPPIIGLDLLDAVTTTPPPPLPLPVDTYSKGRWFSRLNTGRGRWFNKDFNVAGPVAGPSMTANRTLTVTAAGSLFTRIRLTGAAGVRLTATADLTTFPAVANAPSGSLSATDSAYATKAAGDARIVDIPAIPGSVSPELKKVLEPIREYVQTIAGRRGDDLDTAVTFRDLINSGIATLDLSKIARDGAVPISLPVPEELVDLSTPPAPIDFLTTSGIGTIFLSWNGAAFRSYAYTEIWRSSTNDIGSAVLVATSVPTRYADPIGAGGNRYYWVRFVSQAGVAGPFNAVEGTLGYASDDPAYLIDVLSEVYGEAAVANAPFFYVASPTVINGVTVPQGTYIKTAFIADASISSAKISTLVANKITAGFINADVGIRTFRGYASELYAGGTYTEQLDSQGNVVGLTANNPTFKVVGGVADFRVDAFRIFGTGVSPQTAVPFYVDQYGVVRMNTAIIENGAITNALIGNVIQSDVFLPGVVGWQINKNGTAQFNGNVQVRGEVLGGSFTGYAWPAAGARGFYLGPQGLLLGNASSGYYLQYDVPTGFFAVGGNGQALQFNTQTGQLLFSGQLAGAGGTFSGALTAAAVNAVNTINLAGDAVTIPRSAAGSVSGTWGPSVTLPDCVAGIPIVIFGYFDPVTVSSGSPPSSATLSIRLGLSGGTVLSDSIARPHAVVGDGSVVYFHGTTVVARYVPLTSGTYSFQLNHTISGGDAVIYAAQTKR